MKSPDFFIDKATIYSNSLVELSNNLLPEIIDFTVNQTPEYMNQKIGIEELVLKIKLLFSEFDNGQLFYDKIISIEKSLLFVFKKNELLMEYKHILDLFIEHIIEFRK